MGRSKGKRCRRPSQAQTVKSVRKWKGAWNGGMKLFDLPMTILLKILHLALGVDSISTDVVGRFGLTGDRLPLWRCMPGVCGCCVLGLRAPDMYGSACWASVVCGAILSRCPERRYGTALLPALYERFTSSTLPCSAAPVLCKASLALCVQAGWWRQLHVS